MTNPAPPAATAPPVPAWVTEGIDPVVVNAVLIAVRQAANLLCDRWTLLILLSAHAGVSRFGDFRERCGAATRLLTSRLEMLEEQEVMVRMAYMRRPLRHGYHLTHMGLALFDVLAAMQRWEHDWHKDGSGNGSGTGAVFEHTGCGQSGVLPVQGCAACRSAVSPRDVDLSINQKEVQQMPPKATAYRRSTHNVATAVPTQRLPLPHSLDIFGDKWSIEVIMCAFVRVNSFSGFQAHAGMSTNILADRLARLTAAGILRTDTTEGNRRSGYRLTAKGAALFPVLVAIEAWADTWLRDRYRSPLRLTHAACGQPLKIVLRCSHCQQPWTRDNCNLRIG